MTTTAPNSTVPSTTARPAPLAGNVRAALLTSLLFAGAIFGFFYAWVCSTMWGLDAADPRTAIGAMQAMNASVRNAVFFPAFFLTPVVVAGTGFLLHRSGRRASSVAFFAAAGLYLVGGLVLTMAINVPMNEDLAQVTIPTSIDEAAKIWSDYSGPWQVANVARTIVSGLTVMLIGVGLTTLDVPQRGRR